ncbi:MULTISPECIES: CPBP family intramembrane glutamic endopeptidase [Bacillus]|uniref:CPBP family intramembrane glutamic endopeptidase n=1 Tax=Bacillus TaxID=1386 RepID=UPI0009510E82|nr:MULTISPECIES: type II CAAX endopeptidase family protein [Bacillus]MBS9802188.1 CPBP family intramembrane metalloprotease [Bacillus toyonensis]AUB63468.1 CPBP family intramembrane metalloprotease [Bacillus cereus]MCU4712663.1 CPBP family intramembrane metalloprotease [Bacillus cereus]MDA1763336.1 type II CAAX endopeptidase family protein [Bacillus cereus]MED2873231.1 type II CAAX endopeptidase family protein [Bacillus thuringiensis]
MGNEIKRYVICTLIFTWTLWGLLISLIRLNITTFGTPLAMILFIFGGIMPAIIAISLKKKYGSQEEFRSFIKNIVNPKHHFAWYILIIILAFISCYLPTIFGGAKMQTPLYVALLSFPIMIVGGGLEEIGWRGFLQPALQKRFSVFLSTVIVSGIWAIWHWPLWFIPGTNQTQRDFIAFIITTFAVSFLLTTIINATKSIFMCLIFHALLNSFWSVYVPNDKVLPAFSTCIFGIFVFILYTFIIKRKNLLLIR